MVNLYYLFGALLGYPDCCVKHFDSGGGRLTNGNITYDGFVPCISHAKLSRAELVEIIGRDIKELPFEFEAFFYLQRSVTDDDGIYAVGLKVYRDAGMGDFFNDCWTKANGK